MITHLRSDRLNGNELEASGGRNRIIWGVILFVVLLVSYSNSFHADWHYDDFENITENRNLHLKNLDVDGITKSFFFRGEFSRPVSYLSFALNYYVGGTDVFGYHVINFIIHFLASLFLFLLIHGTLHLPSLKDRYGKHALPVAGFSTLLWALSPLHVPAVTVIVQRMASLAGLLYVMAMYFYLRARTVDDKGKKIGYFSLCLSASLLAFGTKENTAVLPLAILLYEVLLLQPPSRDRWKLMAKWSAVPVCLLIGLAFLYPNVSGLLDGYQDRPFSLTERLLTEARIFFYYLGLLFYPLPERLALLHDVTLSRSLFEPWTTFLSISCLVFYVGASFHLARRWPLISFCALYFLINHLIEGTIIPLELIFEHRNYVPSMFVFVPLVLMCMHLWALFASRTVLRGVLLSAGLLILFFQVYTVHDRNRILGQDMTLWLDNAAKYPNLSLVHVQLAKNYYQTGNSRDAFIELSRAYELNHYSNTFQMAEVEYNLGQMFNSIDRHAKALEFYNKSIHSYPSYIAPLAGIALVKWKEGKLLEAYDLMQKVLSKKPDQVEYHERMGSILLHLGRYREADQEAVKALSLDSASREAFMIRAEVLRKAGDISAAIRLWRSILQKDPSKMVAMFALIELYDQLGDEVSQQRMVKSALLAAEDQPIRQVIRQAALDGRVAAYRPQEERLLRIFHEGALNTQE